MRIAVLQNGNYLLGEDNAPLVFDTVKEALKYLAEQNYTLDDILTLDFEVEAQNA